MLQEPNYMLQELAKISEEEGVLTRTFLSPAHIRAAEQLKEWMAGAGLTSWIDGVGNVHGQLSGKNAAADEPLLVVGSHYDTVRDGGKYDGALGIISGIAAAKALAMTAALEAGALRWPRDFASSMDGPSDDRAGDDECGTTRIAARIDMAAPLLQLPADIASTLTGPLRPVRVVGFTDEEGVRFGSTYLGSRALTGHLAGSGALDSRDRSGASLAEALAARPGLGPDADGTAPALGQLSLGPGKIRAYVEVHMEQGPVLEAVGQPLAAVSGIAGQTRLALVLAGEQGHAGTVPMATRRDPLPAAAEIVLALERRCNGGLVGSAGEDDNNSKNNSRAPSTTTGLVCTVGTLEAWPGASNVIPGSVKLNVDIRSQSDEERELVVADTIRGLEDVCARRGLRCEWEQTHAAPAVLADAALAEALTAAIRDSRGLVEGEDVAEESNDAGPTAKKAAAPNAPGPLVSGAGHDAAEMASIAPMGMMFVRCRASVSHSPEEYVAPEDVGAATAALYTFLQADQKQQQKD